MANLSNINNKFLVTTGGNVLIGQTSVVGSSILQVTGNATFAGDVLVEDNLYLTDAGTVRGKIQLNSSDRDNLDIKAISLGSLMRFYTVNTLALTLDASQNVKLTDEKILGLRTSTTDYALQYRDLDFRLIGSADGTTQRKFSFGYYTSDNPAGTWNGKTYINSYTGNVGIGTTSPTASLGIQANFTANGSYTTDGWARYLVLDAENTGGGGIIWTKQSSTYNRAILNNQGKMEFGRSTANDASAAWLSDLAIDASGNVGIKTSSPSDFLSWQQQLVVGNGSADAGITIYHGSGSGNQGAIVFADGNTGTNRYRGSISYNGADEMKFFTSTLERIKINDAGNVFISTPITNAFYGLSLTYNNTNTADFTVNQATGQIKIGGVATGYFPTFYAGGSERMRITTVGDIQFTGNSHTPYIQLVNSGRTEGNPGYTFNNDTNTGMFQPAGVADTIAFSTGGIERMRIKSAGCVTIGNTSPESDVQLTVRRPNDLGNNVGNYQRLAAFQNSTSNFNQLYINSVRDANGTDWTTQGMRLSMKVDSTWMGYMQFNGSGNNAGISFGTGTTTSAPGSVTERMRITSTGTIFMYGLGGYTSSNADVRYATSSKELYYQTSSKRYKTNILNLENSLDKINKLRPVRYVDINTEEPACGLIAEETVEIIPEVVFTKKIEGFDKPQVEGINYSDLVPFLIKSIQELKAEIELLKSK